MLCYKNQGNHVVYNELPSGTVGWVVAGGTVGFGSSNLEGSFFSLFSKFLSLVSFFRVRLSVSVRVRIVVRFRF